MTKNLTIIAGAGLVFLGIIYLYNANKDFNKMGSYFMDANTQYPSNWDSVPSEKAPLIYT